MNMDKNTGAFKILLIEDNPADVRLIQEMLVDSKNMQFDLEWKDNLSAGLEHLTSGEIDVILLDLNLPDSRGFDTFARTQEKAQEVPILVLTGINDETLAIRAMQEGSQDYLVKGQIDSNLLVRAIRYAMERKRVQAILKDYAAKLEETNRFKDLFTDIIRHDLLNPLSVIKTVIEFELNRTRDERILNSLLMIKRNTDKLIDMIKSASTYAKLESAEELEKYRMDLSDVFRTVAENFRFQLEEKNMKLEYLAKSGLYAVVSPTIEYVFSNLLSNAIKYSPSGKRIEVNIIDKNNSYLIYVRDWGYGIKDEEKARLFTRFQRVNKKGVKGTGLGLAIVKRVVDLHRGKVWIEDNPEGGSVFYVEIPKD